MTKTNTMNSGISANSATNTPPQPGGGLALEPPSSTRPTKSTRAAWMSPGCVAQRRARLVGAFRDASSEPARNSRPTTQRVGALDRRPRRAARCSVASGVAPSAALSGRTAMNIGLAALADRLLERRRRRSPPPPRPTGRRRRGRSASAAAASLDVLRARRRAGRPAAARASDEQDAHAQPPSTPRSRSRSSSSFFSSRALDDRDQHRAPSARRPWRRASASAACRAPDGSSVYALVTFTPLVSKRVSAPLRRVVARDLHVELRARRRRPASGPRARRRPSVPEHRVALQIARPLRDLVLFQQPREDLRPAAGGCSTE